MSLRGFKFEFHDTAPYKRYNCRLMILEVKNGRSYFEVKNGKEIAEVDITDKIEKFCRELRKMNINEWNMREFDYPMTLELGYNWKLEIMADGINVLCSGSDNMPENWNDFCKALSGMGIGNQKKFPFSMGI